MKYDITYLLKLQIVEYGTQQVRKHAATLSEIHTAQHGRAEFISAAFRKVREGAATLADLQRLIAQLHSDCDSGAIVILPLTDAIIDRLESVYLTAPATTYLRAADALQIAADATNERSGILCLHSWTPSMRVQSFVVSTTKATTSGFFEWRRFEFSGWTTKSLKFFEGSSYLKEKVSTFSFSIMIWLAGVGAELRLNGPHEDQ